MDLLRPDLPVRRLHLRDGTRARMEASGIVPHLDRIGVEFVVDDARVGEEERRDLLAVLDNVRGALVSLTTGLSTSHALSVASFDTVVADMPAVVDAVRDDDRVSVARIEHDFELAPQADYVPPMIDLEINPMDRATIEAEFPVANWEILGIHLVDGGDDVSSERSIQAALRTRRDQIGSNATRDRFNQAVELFQALIDADAEQYRVQTVPMPGTIPDEARHPHRLEIGGVDALVVVAAPIPGAAGDPVPPDPYETIRHFEGGGRFEQRFHQFMRKLMVVRWQLAQIPDVGLAGLRSELQVLAMDFLVKGALINWASPFQDQDLTPLEYRGSRTNGPSMYHRAQEHTPVVQLFREVLCEHEVAYAFLFRRPDSHDGERYGEKQDQTLLVDGPSFLESTLSSHFNVTRARVAAAVAGGAVDTPVLALGEAYPALEDMIDVSRFVRHPVTPATLRTDIDAIRAAIAAHPDAMAPKIVVAQFRIHNVDMLHIFDTARNGAERNALKACCRKTINPQVGYGARPDIIRLREVLPE